MLDYPWHSEAGERLEASPRSAQPFGAAIVRKRAADDIWLAHRTVIALGVPPVSCRRRRLVPEAKADVQNDTHDEARHDTGAHFMLGRHRLELPGVGLGGARPLSLSL